MVAAAAPHLRAQEKEIDALSPAQGSTAFVRSTPLPNGIQYEQHVKKKIFTAMIPLAGIATILGVTAFFQPELRIGSLLLGLEGALGVLSLYLVWPKAEKHIKERKAA